MMTAHQQGGCVISVYTRDVAGSKARKPPTWARKPATR